MFDIGFPELLVIGLVALLAFGPDRLPEFVRTAARLLNQVRGMAAKAQQDVREELGPELSGLDLRELDPQTFIRKHLLDVGDKGDDEHEAGGPTAKSAARTAPYDDEAT